MTPLNEPHYAACRVCEHQMLPDRIEADGRCWTCTEADVENAEQDKAMGEYSFAVELMADAKDEANHWATVLRGLGKVVDYV